MGEVDSGGGKEGKGVSLGERERKRKAVGGKGREGQRGRRREFVKR